MSILATDRALREMRCAMNDLHRIPNASFETISDFSLQLLESNMVSIAASQDGWGLTHDAGTRI